MDTVGWMRRLHPPEKRSRRAIERIAGLSRNTVAQWLRRELSAS